MISYYSIREDQNGTDTWTTTSYASPTTTWPRTSPCLTNSLLTHKQLFWMAIVAEHSIGRVWQEEGERNGDAFRLLNGTDPALQIPLRMIYTTRPTQDFSDQ
uniref:Uncharacterized protein n=1 Tax=Heterorhabditis bacteriophora TaxID=37862 RepID=A0A1I7WT28_HETBA